jgi:hypothetical protein
MAFYNNTSPYYNTSVAPGYLDLITFRTIPASTDDILYTLPKTYQHRPDLLAYHLYNDVKLWWVFAARNPEIIVDPVYDMESGIQFYLPQLTLMKKALGF